MFTVKIALIVKESLKSIFVDWTIAPLFLLF